MRDRLLSNADLLGAIGTLTAPLSNWSAKWKPTRIALEMLLGVDRDRPLPRFHRTTFDRWFRKREKRLAKRVAGRYGKVVLLPTCKVNYNRPGIGKSTVAVLSEADIRVACPEQRCCGRPYLERGDVEGALENLRFNLRTLRHFVDKGYVVVVLQPGCGRMLQKDYPWLDSSEDAVRVAGATREVTDYMLELLKQGAFGRIDAALPGTLLYHRSCLSGVQGDSLSERTLLESIPGLSIKRLDGCAGEGSLEEMRIAHSDRSPLSAAGQDAAMEGTERLRIVSDCARAADRIEKETERPVYHPVEIFCEALGLSAEC